MPRERPIDRANRAADATLVRVGGELRDGRLDRGLSIDAASAAAAISNAEWSRIERHRSPRVPLVTLVRCGAVVGLDVSVRLYPGGPPVRDAGHVALLGTLRGRLHPSLRWATEVPMPIPGDQRAWDATIGGPGWIMGVEAETRPRDAQALQRRLQLKLRDSHASALILLLRESRATRAFLREAADELAPAFPIPGRRALELLGAGVSPDGSSIIIVPVPLRTSGRHTPGV